MICRRRTEYPFFLLPLFPPSEGSLGNTIQQQQRQCSGSSSPFPAIENHSCARQREEEREGEGASPPSSSHVTPGIRRRKNPPLERRLHDIKRSPRRAAALCDSMRGHGLRPCNLSNQQDSNGLQCRLYTNNQIKVMTSSK